MFKKIMKVIIPFALCFGVIAAYFFSITLVDSVTVWSILIK